MLHPGILLLVGGLAALLSLALVHLVRLRGLWFGALRPVRQFHQTHGGPIPRLGGLGLAVALGVGLLGISQLHPNFQSLIRNHDGILLGAAGMFLLGFLADLRPLPWVLKLGVQAACATLAVTHGLRVSGLSVPFLEHPLALGMCATALSVAWLILTTNLVKWMSTLDGLAGSVSLLVLAVLIYVAHQNGAHLTTWVGVLLAGGLAGFLWHNLPPARVHLGDGGSYLVGYIIGALAVVNTHKGPVTLALLAPLLALGVPLVDAGLSISRRGGWIPGLRGASQPIHHQLVRQQFPKRLALALLVGVSAVFTLVGMAVVWTGGNRWSLALGLVAVAGFLAFHFAVRLENWPRTQVWLDTFTNVRREVRYALALGRCLEMSAERLPTVEALWDEFGEALGRLNLARAVLEGPNPGRTWRHSRLPPQGPPGLSDRRDLPFRQSMVLTVYGLPEWTSPRLFFLLSEVLSEAWLNAVNRWEETHGGDLLAIDLSEADAAPAGGRGTPPPTVDRVTSPGRNR
ncbi:MAG: hypothetical protein ACKO3N_21455 [Verrucomicrobiota bacterium]